MESANGIPESAQSFPVQWHFQCGLSVQPAIIYHNIRSIVFFFVILKIHYKKEVYGTVICL